MLACSSISTFPSSRTALSAWSSNPHFGLLCVSVPLWFIYSLGNNLMSLERLQRWRLILGKAAEDPFKPAACRMGCTGDLLSGDMVAMDEALDVVYAEDEGIDLTKEEWEREPGGK